MKWQRLPFCLMRLCPCRHYSDAGGCGGQCVHCGKIVGYVTQAELQLYAARALAGRTERQRENRSSTEKDKS